MWWSNHTNLIKVLTDQMIRIGKIRRTLIKNENNENKSKNRGKIVILTFPIRPLFVLI